MVGGWRRFWGERRLLREKPLSPQTPLSRRAAGVRVDSSFRQAAPASWARFPASGLWSRRLTEPPRPAQCWATIKLQGKRAEGVAGAIGKLPDGLRPPPRLRRGEIPLASAEAKSPLPPSAEGGGPFAERMVEDIPPRRGNALPGKGAYPQSCAALPAKPPLKGEVPAIGGRRGSSPNAARSRRLCQPP